MRLAIADYSGHAFPVQLSRELAHRGHDVLHLYFAGFLSPKGRLSVDDADPPTLTIEAVSLDRPFAKYSLFRRRFQEVEIGRRLAARVAEFSPEVAIGCNLPLDPLDQLLKRSRAQGRPFVFWQQDIYSTAITKILARNMGPLGRLIGRFYRRIERRALEQSTAVVVIADEFREAIGDRFGVVRDHVHVIENWAPLTEIAMRPKSNAWSERHGLAKSEVVLYSGTLGLKHDASKLLSLAEALRGRPDTAIVVVSEGLSADWLAAEAIRRNLPHLRVLPFQPFADYPDVLASADVLVSLLEPDAGAFSVPSKILSYLCAGRAVVISAPSENLAHRIIRTTGAGIAVCPQDTDQFVDAIRSLLDSAPRRNKAGQSGRRYAEREFDIGKIADRFEKILAESTGGRRAGARPETVTSGQIIAVPKQKLESSVFSRQEPRRRTGPGRAGAGS